MKNLKLLLLFIIFLLFTNCDRKNDIMLPIYLDNQATTPIDIRVLKVMTEAFANNYGNPHSQHQMQSSNQGWP